MDTLAHCVKEAAGKPGCDLTLAGIPVEPLGTKLLVKLLPTVRKFTAEILIESEINPNKRASEGLRGMRAETGAVLELEKAR